MNDTKLSRGEGRARIFQAAAEIVYERGLEKAQTRMVTERAQVGRGLLNHYFKWPELRAAAWETLFQAAVSDLWRAGEAPAAAMDRFVSEAFTKEARLFWRLWIEAERLAPADAPIRAALTRIRRQLRERLVEVLQAGAQAGVWTIQDAQTTAIRLEALRDGLAGLIMAEDPDMDNARAQALLKHQFIKELG
ncbi:TetR family transcriptional regulator C-terminal domain-containing protein [Oceanicaulis sp. MMSF_3324]|uniref:TetR family transcriptional regulator C-terminal domain-containing protein n=1 Tax=Oceanicaulis sp. MMSF_3324 TaxID=3046702 RepID=UPI00273FB695|nr:TetR family transcriptional regulator C-terminal domain-containing protein [Oceanicaulis sp. MMSF_3324]